MTQGTLQATAAWALDPAHSQVEFAVKHMMFATVKGRFRTFAGTAQIDEANPDASSVTVEIDAASIDTGVADRDGHLRSADFFDVTEYPTVTFRSKRIEGAAFEPGARFTVIGDLTVRGTTREIALHATFEGRGVDPFGQEKAGFAAEAKLDRHEFGLTWNQALETGGVLVGREIRLTLDVQFVRPAA